MNGCERVGGCKVEVYLKECWCLAEFSESRKECPKEKQRHRKCQGG